MVVTGHNTNKDFAIEANLNSIFTQNYSNYRVVIIDDGSDDGSQEVIEKYLKFYGIG